MTNRPIIKNRKTPQRQFHYIGRLTDSRHWDRFEYRTDDVFICTPPKCGTTWTQAICANLIFGTTDFDGKLTDISPWFDSKIDSLDNYLARLEAQKHRRFIKTHTPLDGMPYYESSQYLIIYRNPIDAYFSIRNHMLNMLDPPDIPQLANDPREGFYAWVDAPFEEGVGEQRSLEAFIHHYSSYKNYQDLENFNFFHFSDMKRDIRSTVQRFANILGIELSQRRNLDICEAVNFSEMKKKASSYAPASGKPIFKSDEAFFNSGKNSQWRGILKNEELKHYSFRINELLSSKDVDWIENGSGL